MADEMESPPRANEIGDPRTRWHPPRCGYRANAMMLWTGSHFLGLGYFFVWFGAVIFSFVSRARRASIAYLERLRPGRSIVRKWWQTYRHMMEYGFLLLDRALMLAKPQHGFGIECDGRSHLLDAAAAGGGVMMLTGHFGNAEAVAPYMQKTGLATAIHIVMYRDNADGTEHFHARHQQELSKVHLINTTDPLTAGIKIIAALRRGELVALRADRTMRGKSLPAKLLGGDVHLPAGPFVAAALSGAAVVNVYTCRLGYRRYECLISAARRYGEDQGGTRDERIAMAASDYAKQLEAVVRRYPYQWGNFYDVWAPVAVEPSDFTQPQA